MPLVDPVNTIGYDTHAVLLVINTLVEFVELDALPKRFPEKVVADNVPLDGVYVIPGPLNNS